MDVDNIKIIDKTIYRDREIQSKIPVPKWFLNKIGDAETVEEVHDCIVEMSLSDEQDLCKRKSIHLAEVRIKVINHDEEQRQKRKS